MKKMGKKTTKVKIKRRRALIWKALIFGILILIFLIYLGLPIIMAFNAILPAREAAVKLPPSVATHTLTTEDGVTLQCWYTPPENGVVILLIPGAGNSKTQMQPYAEILTAHGYGVLALDLRGHGESGGKTNRLGWEGSRDVAAAVRFLESRQEVISIGGLGISLGGEVLLGAASQVPEIEAIVADGATHRCLSELLTLESERTLWRNFTARVMYAAVGILRGEKEPLPLLVSAQEASTTSFLLIAAGNNPLEVSFNLLFQETLVDRSNLWVVPEVNHTGAYIKYPQEYEDRIITFFDQVFSSSR